MNDLAGNQTKTVIGWRTINQRKNAKKLVVNLSCLSSLLDDSTKCMKEFFGHLLKAGRRTNLV